MGGGSERLVVPHREVPFRCGGARRALVHALGAGALVLLFGARAGRDGGRGRGGGAGLLLKVRYDHRHVPDGDSQLLGGAPVNVLQFGPEKIDGKMSPVKRQDSSSAASKQYTLFFPNTTFY